jgi:cytosine/adenosine deaminase-related metal-dependent hydrolase
VGKKADIVLISRDDFELLPITDAAGSVVYHTSPSNIHTVIVDGKLKKANGRLVDDVSGIKEKLRCRGAEMVAQTGGQNLTAREKWLQLVQGTGIGCTY